MTKSSHLAELSVSLYAIARGDLLARHFPLRSQQLPHSGSKCCTYRNPRKEKARAKNAEQNECETLLPLRSYNWSINESPASVWQRYFYVSLKELAALQIVSRGIRIHKQLWKAFSCWPSKSSQVMCRTCTFANTLPGEWLHLIWESGNIVCTEPISGVEISKRRVALGNLCSPISYWKRVGMLGQGGGRGSESWVVHGGYRERTENRELPSRTEKTSRV